MIHCIAIISLKHMISTYKRHAYDSLLQHDCIWRDFLIFLLKYPALKSQNNQKGQDDKGYGTVSFFLLPAERRFMTQKRKPDIILGNYWSDNDHFADLYNAVLFDGKQVLLPENLEELDSNVSQ